MSVTTNIEPTGTPAPETIVFTLPKSDMADLRRSSETLFPLDDETLLQDCGGDVEILQLLLEEFQSNGPRRIEQIARRVEAGNPKAIAVAARDLKTSADSLSARRLRNLAGALEQSIGLVTRGCQERLVARLQVEMCRCLEYIPLVIATARAMSMK